MVLHNASNTYDNVKFYIKIEKKIPFKYPLYHKVILPLVPFYQPTTLIFQLAHSALVAVLSQRTRKNAHMLVWK